jgi:uncharacterized protein YyaL (SSP411 family)
MALGGIYDQIGGGFSRYSTDRFWKVPHFEKMLYDNAQLVSLFSSAFQLTRKPLYKNVILQTLEFIRREMTSPEFPGGGVGIYSSLDADSDGEEGKFYTWSSQEISQILGKDARLISDYFNILPEGNWEKDRNILYRKESNRFFARNNKIEMDDLHKTIARSKLKLMNARSKRTRPALDDKIITAWNSLMITGYVDAYRALNRDEFLKSASNIARFITARMIVKNGQLKRIYSEELPDMDAFLDDYAFTIKAFVSLYGATFNEYWLNMAHSLLNHVLRFFYDPKSGLFFYSSEQNPRLISRKMEITDHVIPASNSAMALNLFHLGHYFQNKSYLEKSVQMLANIKTILSQRSVYHANWASLLCYLVEKPVEIAILGKNWLNLRKKLDRHYLPQVLLLGGNEEGKLPLLQNKLMSGKTVIFICKNHTCQQPVTDIDKALKIILENDKKS